MVSMTISDKCSRIRKCNRMINVSVDDVIHTGKMTKGNRRGKGQSWNKEIESENRRIKRQDKVAARKFSKKMIIAKNTLFKLWRNRRKYKLLYIFQQI